MNKIYNDILMYFLKSNSHITSKELAIHFGVSSRTIKTYIKDINQLCTNTPIIFSSNKGYRVDREKAIQFVYKKTKSNSRIPQNYKERIHELIKRIVIDNESIDLFDLSQEMYVSYSTIKSDISKFNLSINNFNTKLEVKNDKVYIIGEEKNIRRLTTQVIFEEIPNKLMTVDILNKNFNPEDVSWMISAVNPLLENREVRINEFSFMNLILHLLVLVISVRNGRTLNGNNQIIYMRNNSVREMSQMLSEKIQDHFEVTFSKMDLRQLDMIFEANVNYMPTNKFKIIESDIDKQVLNALKQSICQVDRFYGIKLNSEHFMFNFVIHINNLYIRAKNNIHIKNPMKSMLKAEFPIVYDISVFLSVILSDQLKIKIVEDEVAYIALHIGSELEKQKINMSKITTALLCPNYMDLSEKLYSQLNEDYDELNIVLVTFDISEVEKHDIELLITTVPLNSNELGSYNIVEIAPFFDKYQKQKLNNTVESMLQYKKREVFVKEFSQYFDPKLFFIRNDFNEKEEVLKYLCNKLEGYAVVGSDFYPNVLERENASSTAFGRIAIPHSVYMEAYQTKITVLISTEGIRWDEKIVNIIFLTSINYEDRETFAQVYEGLISIFDDVDNYLQLLTINTFDEFELFVKSNIFSK